MAWRPTRYLVEGELDNTHLGKVTGWMRFAGMNDKVTFCLEGDFHRDIRGAKIRVTGDAAETEPPADAKQYMEGFASHQTGKVGDITAGLPPHDYGKAPYIEIYSEENGRIVIELEPVQVEVVGTPIPVRESYPISRARQRRNTAEFLGGIAAEMNLPAQRVVCVGDSTTIKADQRTANNKIRGMKLLTKEIRKKLPPLYSQDGIGVGADGYRHVLGIAEGCKEDKAGWSGFLAYLKQRGLKCPELFISDKCLGLIESLAEYYPEAKWQRCIVHFYRNVFSVVPKAKVKQVAAMLKAIHAQEDHEAAREKAQAVAAKLETMKLHKAAEKVGEGIGETLTYYAFPDKHHRHLRTNNPLERIMREIRRRSRVVGCFPDGNSALMLAAARLRYIASSKWGTRRYMNMEHLKELKQQQEQIAADEAA